MTHEIKVRNVHIKINSQKIFLPDPENQTNPDHNLKYPTQNQEGVSIISP